ncbi:MAG: hypothetical protein QM644_21485 [Mobilitalea sp.]
MKFVTMYYLKRILMVLVVLIPTSIMLYILLRYKTFLGDPLYTSNGSDTYISFADRQRQNNHIFWMIIVIGVCVFLLGNYIKSLIESRKYMKEHPEPNETQDYEEVEEEDEMDTDVEKEEKEDTEE